MPFIVLDITRLIHQDIMVFVVYNVEALTSVSDVVVEVGVCSMDLHPVLPLKSAVLDPLHVTHQ